MGCNCKRTIQPTKPKNQSSDNQTPNEQKPVNNNNEKIYQFYVM